MRIDNLKCVVERMLSVEQTHMVATQRPLGGLETHVEAVLHPVGELHVGRDERLRKQLSDFADSFINRCGFVIAIDAEHRLAQLSGDGGIGELAAGGGIHLRPVHHLIAHIAKQVEYRLFVRILCIVIWLSHINQNSNQKGMVLGVLLWGV